MNQILQIYLPIAEITLNVFLLIAIGVAVGVLAGVFGLGGGLILVPILVAIGVNASVAVATSTNQMTASSFSGVLAYARRKRIDFKLGMFMVLGGSIGTICGVLVFNYFTELGMIDIVISLCCLLILSIVCFTTTRDALIVLYHRFKKMEYTRRHHRKIFSKISLPWKMSFISIRQPISVFAPLMTGFVGGFFVALMGIGGSLVMLPAMMYVLGVSEAFTAGTNHLQIIFTTIIATILHAVTALHLDIILSTILIIGGSIGVQMGVRLGSKFHPDNYRIFFALIILALCINVIYGLVAEPSSLYSVEILGR